MTALIDSHAHFWRRLGTSELLSHDDRPLSPREFTELMDDAGVGATLQVTRYFDPDDGYSIEGASRFPGRFRVIGRFQRTMLDEPSSLAAWAARPHIVGLRVYSHPAEPRLFDDAGSGFWAELERLALPISIYVPGQLKAVRDVALSHPRLPIVLDHVGTVVFRDTPPEERFADWDDALALSDVPSVVAKVSGMPEASREHHPFPGAQVRLREMVAAFGPNRSMWGSNFTPARAVGTYAELADFARQAVAPLPHAGRGAVLSGTAERVFGFSGLSTQAGSDRAAR